MSADAVPTNLVLFDDHCPLCTFQSRVITWLDWFNVTTLLPISHPHAAEVAPQLTRADLLEAIHCVAPSGRIYRGARALRYLGQKMPLLWPTALFLWLPGVIWVAEHVYQFISRNRHVLSRLFGCKEACTLLPARERQQERELAPTPDQSAEPNSASMH
jgi:predicted DCC family thiol-disulfide oxidoreductase YuxK